MKKRKDFDPLAIVSKIASQEKELEGKTFMAPYVGGGKVRLRLDGIIYEMSVSGCPEECWAILKVQQPGLAKFAERAPLSMVRNYLALLPRLRLLLIDQFDSRWWALPADGGNQKMQLTGPVPLHLCREQLASFNTVYCRFDGGHFWYEALDRRRDPAIARRLRESLAADIKPEDLKLAGAVPAEKFAYKMLYLEKHKGDQEVLDERTKISRALAHSGAVLDSYWYANGSEHATVRFRIENRDHVVQIRPGDLQIVSAGICLSGEDSSFDLASLVGVLKEADRNGEYYYYD